MESQISATDLEALNIVNDFCNAYMTHIRAGRKLEAGFILLKYADTLRPTPDLVPEFLVKKIAACDTKLLKVEASNNMNFPNANDAKLMDVELQKNLHLSAANLFDQASHWELALEALKKVFSYYERSLQYQFMQGLCNQMANISDKIASIIREPPDYFYVRFYGTEFEECYKNKSFIYRSKKDEKPEQFKERILKTFAATAMESDDGKKDFEKNGGKYIQIFQVRPTMTQEYLDHLKANIFVRSYYKFHNVFGFEQLTYKRKVDTKWTKIQRNEATETWMEIKIFETFNNLPGTEDHAVVEYEETLEDQHPIQAAIKKIEELNLDLCESAELLVAEAHSKYSTRLSDFMWDVLDKNGAGNFTKFEIFFCDDYIRIMEVIATPDEMEMIKPLKDRFLLQISILECCICCYLAKKRFFHGNLEAEFNNYRSIVEQKFGPAESFLPSSELSSSAPTTTSTELSNPSTSAPKGMKSRFSKIFTNTLTLSRSNKKSEMINHNELIQAMRNRIILIQEAK